MLFRSPERTCSASVDADKLQLEFSNIEIASIGSRNALVTLSPMQHPSYGTQTLDAVLRNNVYAVSATVTSRQVDFSADMLDWVDADMRAGFNDVYSLSLSARELDIPKVVEVGRLIVRCDHTDGWQAKMYSDAACTVPLSDVNTWMGLSQLSGSAAEAEVRVTLKTAAAVGGVRYIQFTAGNKSLVVKVTVI